MNLFPSEKYEKIFTSITKDTELVNANPVFFHENGNKIAVIIDTRFDTIMEGVIRNFMYYMNPLGWNLMIYGISDNRYKIHSIFPNALYREIPENYISETSSGEKTVSITDYNKLLMSEEFWNSLPSENVCIFQRDCVMYKMFPEYFSDLYDYSGANYYTQSHISFFNGGVQGGFSLRKRQCMLDCIKHINWNMIADYRKTMMKMFPGMAHGEPEINLKNEDIFFTYACEILHKTIPDKIHRTFLSIESDINLNTCVMHGWTKYLLPYDQIELLIKNSSLLGKYITDI